VKDIGLRVKGTIKELKDVLHVRHFSSMKGFNVHVAELSFEVKGKVKDHHMPELG